MRLRRLAGPVTAVLLATGLLAGCDAGWREASAPRAALPDSIGQMRAGDLVGRTVYNRAGEEVGVIDDVVVHRRDRVTGAVLSIGGLFGLGASQAVVPVQQLRLEGQRIVGPNLTRETMEKVANYRPRDWDRVDRDRVLNARSR